MSVSKYRWTEECDTHNCVGDCDFCDYNTEDEYETIEPIECPFCGKKNFKIDDEDFYKRLLDENGRAAISMRCKNCCVDMWEHSFSINDYWTRRNMLIKKWNTRVYKISAESLK